MPAHCAASWVGQCGVALAPMVAALNGELRQKAVLHADETPVAPPLDPGSGQAKRAYLWAYGPKQAKLKAVVYNFAASRSGKYARAFLGYGDGHSADQAP